MKGATPLLLTGLEIEEPEGAFLAQGEEAVMNLKMVDSLWLTALLVACSIGFYPAQAAIAEDTPGLCSGTPQVCVDDPPSPQRRPAPRRSQSRLVTCEFIDADLVCVIKALAKDMGRNVYIGPGVEGSVMMNFRSVPAEGALEMVLKDQAGDIRYKLVGYNTLVVASGDKVDCIEHEIMGKPIGSRTGSGLVRQEILLEHASAAKVMGFLRGQYRDVDFLPHPTMNGFYVVGGRSDILQIKRDVPNLDRAP